MNLILINNTIMNFKNLSLLIVMIIVSFSFLNSQKTSDLYMPKEIKKAYENKMRSYKGIAGENYFINKVDYSIKAEFNPETRKLIGKEIITYTNNSPDSLNYLYFNLYQDIFKKGNKVLAEVIAWIIKPFFQVV